ncbi:sugar ABC transporter permease [Streptomyces sp. A3M-1-3]|uniref:sugar ABC transporter permease n=1 Tax=Streptomyces sp. A3M-1-3 TaxID=2962044 RepID=UPI0020B86F27|nr:sugar ABC transporter permease [Streptomyces sp. A3M-1-3]MCP3820892.1 sugar ABC transporter permease [Streptomyces sp. A3M-1-3]
MTTADWAERALAALLGRVAVTEAEVGHRFPLFADPDGGRWTTTGRGSWTGGFWAGLLWLRALHTGAEGDRAVASACTGRLADWVPADTATRGLILWYGTALATGDARAAELRERAGRTCLAAMDPRLGLVPWGSAFGGPRLLARVDGVPGMVPLLAAVGPEGAAAAGSHLDRHLDVCLHEGLLRPACRFEAETGWRACDDPPPGWSRGSAWLMLAVADAIHCLGADERKPRRLAAARQLAAPWTVAGAPLVPAADAALPDGPSDTSAAAIAAVALLKLARTAGPQATEFQARAVATLHHLAHAHLTGTGAGRPPGMLLNGCYDAARGTAVRHELVWGDFFLAFGLAALIGLVDVRAA